MPHFFYNRLLTLLFPEYCLGCGVRNEILCKDCIKKCARCTRPTPQDVFAAFDYHDPIIKKAIWNIKYYNRSPVGPLLGRLLYDAYLEDIADISQFAHLPIIVIPIPLSRKRYKERGYNQAEKIARGFFEAAGTETFTLNTTSIRKIIDTSPQAHILEKNKRLKNISGAFSLADNTSIKGKTIIVIDDVTTTGGTLNEVMTLLKKGGAKDVYGFAVAH